jgi:hypothetical protein
MDDKRNREARHITRTTLDDGALLPVVARSEDINIIVFPINFVFVFPINFEFLGKAPAG